jgi:hypothetical protein
MKHLAVLLALPALAAVDGVVRNATTGKEQPNVLVNLVQPGEGGMKTIGTAKSGPDGKFTIDKPLEGPGLLQGIHQGVIYSLVLQPGAPQTGLTLNVFDTSRDPAAGKMTQRMILLQPTDAEMMVNETLIFENPTQSTFSDPANGSLRFYLPPAAKGQVRVTIAGPGGVPVTREAERTARPDVYKVDYALKPGETRFDLAYVLPKGEFRGRLEHPAPARIVTPPSVTVSGDGLAALGQEPQTKANIYEVKGREFALKVEGTGVLRPAEAAPEEGDGPSIQVIPPRLYARLYWLLALAAGILVLGFVLLYRSEGSRRT